MDEKLLIDIGFYILYALIYFFFCRVSFLFMEYISDLSNNAFNWSEKLKNSFITSYNQECKKPWDSFRKVINKFGI